MPTLQTATKIWYGEMNPAFASRHQVIPTHRSTATASSLGTPFGQRQEDDVGLGAASATSTHGLVSPLFARIKGRPGAGYPRRRHVMPKGAVLLFLLKLQPHHLRPFRFPHPESPDSEAPEGLRIRWSQRLILRPREYMPDNIIFDALWPLNHFFARGSFPFSGKSRRALWDHRNRQDRRAAVLCCSIAPQLGHQSRGIRLKSESANVARRRRRKRLGF